MSFRLPSRNVFTSRVDRPVSSLVALAVVALLMTLAVSPVAAEEGGEIPEQVSFSEHVAPIFFESCVSCHRPNDVAPMSLLTFEEARPWARSIQRAVVERDMPPWDAAPEHGEFANDISLSDREVAIIDRWVSQGAAQGDPAAMPSVPELPPAGSWRMGREPDYVIDLAAVEVPADGPDLFVTQVFGIDLPEDQWVQAIELLPGNTEVLHHTVTYLGPFGMNDDDDESNSGVQKLIYLNERAKRPIGMAEAPSIGGVWVAGSPPTIFPEGTGHPLAKNELISLNMHYHPSGNAGSDSSKVGFYFGEGELEKVITTAFAADPGIMIPAGAGDHLERAVYLFAQDSKILSLLPHMHNRGKAMRYTLVRPNGDREVLLDVPEYDYDWQNIYRFEEPVSVSAGSIIEVEAVWDNSAGNAANPNPDVDLHWGDGTNDEMLVAFVDFIVDEGQKPRGVRVDEQISQLLDRHDPSYSYAVKLDQMAFGGPWGLVAPPEGEGEGMLYLWMGSLMFSTSIAEIYRVGDEVLLNAGIITGGGGTRAPLAFLATIGSDGTIAGEAFFGRVLTPENLDELRGKGQGFRGQSVASTLASSSAGAH